MNSIYNLETVIIVTLDMTKYISGFIGWASLLMAFIQIFTCYVNHCLTPLSYCSPNNLHVSILLF